MLQIAAHEDDVPVEQLYDYCRMARKIMQGEHGVGRIIARPYVGKISDIFAGRSISRTLGINKNNEDGMEKTLKLMDEDFTGLAFVNLVDFDMQYGHRRNIDGYAKAATVFDRQLGEFMAKMKDDDILMITADHGCDPGAPGTDHTREYVPLLMYGKHVKAGLNLGTYPTFAMIGATISDMFGADLYTKGESLLPRIIG